MLLASALLAGGMATVAMAGEPFTLTAAQMDAVIGGADPTNPATDNRDWGQTTKQMTRVDDDQPGIGDHASAPPGFEPGDGGRKGVGNVTKDDFGSLSEGGQGLHARVVGKQMGVSPTPRP
jgi:hypothetical protein